MNLIFLKKNILISFVSIILLVACGNGINRDIVFWNKHRQEFMILNKNVIAVFQKTGIKLFTRYAVGPVPESKIEKEAISKYYPEHVDEIKQIMDEIIFLNFHEITVGEGYVSFFWSGGLGTDTFLLHQIDENGLNEFAKNIGKFGYKIRYKKELEEDWLYIYTD